MTIARFLTLLAALLFVLTLQRAAADTNGSFAGNVTHVNPNHIGVKTGTQSRDFLIPSDFDNTISGKTHQKIAYSSIKSGAFVTVFYTTRTILGTSSATKIVVGGQLNFPSFSIKPLPSASP